MGRDLKAPPEGGAFSFFAASRLEADGRPFETAVCGSSGTEKLALDF